MSRSSSRSRRALRVDQALVTLLAFLLVSIMGGLLGAALVMPAVATTGQVTRAGTELFSDLPAELGIPEPSERSTILASDGTVLSTFYAENRIIVESEAIDNDMRNAVVAIEDERFYQHNGVDLQGIMRATVNNLTGGALAGASTLTQQYVKNLLIEQGRRSGDAEAIEGATETSLGRKLREAQLAIALEQQQSKDEILTGYLNIAQFGPSVYGVESAAQHYFNHSAADMSVAESALLAGITQSPARWDPVAHPDNAQVRRDLVLDNMLRLEFITEEQHAEAIATPVEEMLDVTYTQNGCGAAGNAAYFCDYVVKDLLANEEWGESLADRQAMLYRGGLTITTTLDLDRQAAAYETVTANVPVTDPSDIRMALTSIEPGTGRIQAMVQNTNYGPPTETDQDATLINLNVGTDRGGGNGFLTGSFFKVFTLTEWVDEGHSINDRVNATDREFRRAEWNISCMPEVADDYDPGNLESGLGAARGLVTVLDATARSINTPFIEMGTQLDLCGIIDTAAAMGVDAQANGDPMVPRPSMLLGTNQNTPIQIAEAVATLAAEGVHCDPVAILAVTDSAGNDVPLPPASCEEALAPEVAAEVTTALESVVQPNSTGSNAVLPDGRPAAGKTGTANLDAAAWFAGYTPQLASAIWMGHIDSNESMFDSTINGQFHEEVYGGLYPAMVFSEYTARALEGEPVLQFPDRTTNRPSTADDDDDDAPGVNVPDVVGYSVDDATTLLERAGFTVSVGAERPSEWRAGGVAASSPASGSSAPRGSVVNIYPSSGPPSEEPASEPPTTEEPSPSDPPSDDETEAPSGGDD
ncbi:transglycosylase domain-containing protein [Georgenia sp. Z1491]|uniref:penicillin-binding protein n=1 Tax=Georgenia sp. Z1491 TaxID=3416707 RepID=UPI003CF62F04